MGVCRLRFGSHSLSSLRKAIRGTLVDLAKQTQVTNKHFAEFANIVRNAEIRKAVQQIPTRVSSRQLEQAKSPVEDHETRGYKHHWRGHEARGEQNVGAICGSKGQEARIRNPPRQVSSGAMA